jgi:adhesin transport system outer membrane protein
MLQVLHAENFYSCPDGLDDSTKSECHVVEGASTDHTHSLYTSKSFYGHLGRISLSAGTNLSVSSYRLGALCLVLLFPVVIHADTLEQLITDTLKDHPAIRNQKSQKAAAEATVETAKWQYYPTPSINVQSKYNNPETDPSYRGDPVAVTLDLQQPIWTGGQLTAGLDKANAGVELSNAALEEARLQIATRVVQSYSDWLAAYQKIQLYNESMQTYVHLNDMVKHRVEEGASSESDLVLVVSRLKSLAGDTAMAKAQMNTAIGQLEQLLNRHLSNEQLSESIAEPKPIKYDLPVLLDQAILANPTIQKSKAQAQVQLAMIDASQANLSPQVYVRAEQQFGNISFQNAGNDPRIFLGVNTSFGAGLSTLTAIDSAKAHYQAALADVDTQSLMVNTQVISDFSLASNAEIRLQVLKQSQQASEDIFKSYDRQFLAGKRTWQDTLNAVRDLISIGTQIADTQSSQLSSTWRLEIYSQGVQSVERVGQ